MTAIRLSATISQAQRWLASGVIGSEKRRKP